MPDSVPPASPSDGPPAGESGAAAELIRAVTAWYSEQIMGELRAAAPDRERVEQLKQQQQACTADQRALLDADPQEVARLTDLYRARYRELTQPGGSAAG